MKQIKIFVLSVLVAAKRLFRPLIENVQNLVPEIQLFSASHLPFRKTFLPSNIFQKETFQSLKNVLEVVSVQICQNC